MAKTGWKYISGSAAIRTDGLVTGSLVANPDDQVINGAQCGQDTASIQGLSGDGWAEVTFDCEATDTGGANAGIGGFTFDAGGKGMVVVTVSDKNGDQVVQKTYDLESSAYQSFIDLIVPTATYDPTNVLYSKLSVKVMVAGVMPASGKKEAGFNNDTICP